MPINFLTYVVVAWAANDTPSSQPRDLNLLSCDLIKKSKTHKLMSIKLRKRNPHACAKFHTNKNQK